MTCPWTARWASWPWGSSKKVEILKALYINAGVLIMDEPTAVLTPRSPSISCSLSRISPPRGSSVVFITHKMKEVMEVADRIVVMRNGVVVDEVRRADTDEQQLARLMIGQEIVPPPVTRRIAPAIRC